MLKSLRLKHPGFSDLRIAFARPGQPDQLLGYGDPSAPDCAIRDRYQSLYSEASYVLDPIRTLQADWIVRRLSHLVPRSAKWLDVGCGKGLFVKQVRRADPAANVIGIDPGLEQETPDLRKASVNELETLFPSDLRFDVITLLDVLEHFEDPDRLMTLLDRRLAAEGWLVVKVPNKNSAIYRFARWTSYILPAAANRLFARLYQLDYPPPHYLFYDAISLTTLLGRHGFESPFISYMTEVPWRLIWSRLWGIRRALKPIALVWLVFIKMGSWGPGNDTILLCARRGRARHAE